MTGERSSNAWQVVREGGPNPLVDALAVDHILLACLPAEMIRTIMTHGPVIGSVPERARDLAAVIRAAVDTPRLT